MTDRKYCRLCLKTVQAGFVLENYHSARTMLIRLFPAMNLNLTYTVELCLECLKNVNFISDVTDQGIKMQQLELSKPYPKTNFELCRVCFKLQDINVTSITRSSQVVDLQKIIAVALFPLNLNGESEVVVCNQCWYWLQKFYHFKKQCFEVEQSLTLYRQQNNLTVLNESHVEAFLMNANTIFSIQDDIEFTKNNIYENLNGQNERTRLISECTSESDMPVIGCLKFEADEPVILYTCSNEENFLPSELTDCETTEDDVFIETFGVANSDTDSVSVDVDVPIENDIIDLVQKFRTSYEGKLQRASRCWGCYICEAKYFHKQSIIKHILAHETFKNKYGQFKCNLCPFRSSHQRGLSVHNAVHKKCYNGKFVNILVFYYCALCNTEYESKTETQLHVGEHIKNFKDYWCSECMFSTDTPQGFRVHFMGNHNKSKDQSFSCKHKY